MPLLCGCLKRVIKWSLYVGIFLAALAFVPNLPPHHSFSSIDLEEPLPRVGALEENSLLKNAQQLHLNKIHGPEAFAVLDGEIYSGLASGELVKFSSGGHVTYVTKLGLPCAGIHEEDKCGRVLGIVADEQAKKLYVADAYHGISSVDPRSGKSQLLVSPRTEVNGKVPKMFNGVAMAGNGNLYWTDSCSEYPLKDMVYGSLIDPAGRLFYYNAATNSSKVLLDGLWFPNGVAVSPDGQSVVVAETLRYRLLRHYVAGPKAGQTEVFVAGLPGAPDNLRPLPSGAGVLVGLYTASDSSHPLLARRLAATPALRRALARLVRLIELPFEFAAQYYPHVVLDEIVYFIGNLKPASGLMPPTTGLLHVDWSGQPVASYLSTDGSLRHVSDGLVHNDKLYLGSPHANFLGVVPAPDALKKAFVSKTAEKPAKQTQKPVETKPKPVEIKPTTEKPTTVKTTTEKSTTAKPTTQKPTTAKPTTTTPKPEPAAKATQKPAETAKPQAKPVETKPAPAKSAESKPAKQAEPAKKVEKSKVKEETKPREQIPIQEEIPSDTAKPTKDKIKVITKEGPGEIPNYTP